MINDYAVTDPYHSDNIGMTDQNYNDKDDSDQGSLSVSDEAFIGEDPLAGLGQYRDIIEEYADEKEASYVDAVNNQCAQRSFKKNSDLLLGRDDPANSAWGWKPAEIIKASDNGDRAPTKNRGKCLFLMWLSMGVVFLAFATTLVVILVQNNKSHKNRNSLRPQEQDQEQQHVHHLDYNFLLDKLTPISGRDDLLNNTVRNAAMSWLHINWGPTMDEASIVETYAVLVLYFSTHSDQWKSHHNFFLNSNVSICNWHVGTSKGIYCDKNNQVETVSLQRCNLQGTIPHELSVLDDMKYFYAYNNKLTGTIPPEIVDYHSLAMVHFAVDNNLLTGVIPKTFHALNHLEILSVEHNQLGGIIWTEFGDLPKLMQLRLANNKLRGTIPSELGRIYALRELIISNNQFQGTFPTEIGKCLQLNRVDLSNNEFTTNLDPIFCNRTAKNTVSSVFPENFVVVEEDSCNNPPHQVRCSCCCCTNCTE